MFRHHRPAARPTLLSTLQCALLLACAAALSCASSSQPSAEQPASGTAAQAPAGADHAPPVGLKTLDGCGKCSTDREHKHGHGGHDGGDEHARHRATHGSHRHDDAEDGERKHGEHPRGRHEHGDDGARQPDAVAADDGKPDHYAHRFDDAKRWSRSFDAKSRDAWQKPAEVVALLELQPGHVVADIGAGTGYFLPHLSATVGETGTVLGLDVEPDMVAFMTRRARRDKLGNVTARKVEAGTPALTPGSVDRILIVNTWHHIPKRVAYSKSLAAALRPGGAIAIVDYTTDAPRGPPAEHRLSEAQVIAELEAAGLAATVATETLPMQYVVIARRPQ